MANTLVRWAKTHTGQETACAAAGLDFWDSLASPFICAVWIACAQPAWLLSTASELHYLAALYLTLPQHCPCHESLSTLQPEHTTSWYSINSQTLCTSFNGDCTWPTCHKVIRGRKKRPDGQVRQDKTDFLRKPEENKVKGKREIDCRVQIWQVTLKGLFQL